MWCFSCRAVNAPQARGLAAAAPRDTSPATFWFSRNTGYETNSKPKRNRTHARMRSRTACYVPLPSFPAPSHAHALHAPVGEASTLTPPKVHTPPAAVVTADRKRQAARLVTVSAARPAGVKGSQHGSDVGAEGGRGGGNPRHVAIAGYLATPLKQVTCALECPARASRLKPRTLGRPQCRLPSQQCHSSKPTFPIALTWIEEGSHAQHRLAVAPHRHGGGHLPGRQPSNGNVAAARRHKALPRAAPTDHGAELVVVPAQQAQRGK